MPKLSIITINYNNAAGLRKTMESVINQTSRDFEYIIIDGGSTDGSVDIIKQHADKLSYWVSEPDKGLYNAQNKGTIRAKGEFCQFLNSGDFMAGNDVVEKMLATLPADCNIYFGNMLEIVENGKVYTYKRYVGTPTMLTFYRGAITHSSALIKRSLFEKYGMYDESLKIVADWKFYLITIGLHKEPAKYVDLDFTYFDKTGISTMNVALDKQERRNVLEQYIPPGILVDYDKYWFDIEQMRRLKSYALTRWLVYISERMLFKWEKFKRSSRSRTIKE